MSDFGRVALSCGDVGSRIWAAGPKGSASSKCLAVREWLKYVMVGREENRNEGMCVTVEYFNTAAN